MISITTADIAGIVDGALRGPGDVLVTGEVQTDSRLVGPGDVFIAMPGEVTDGHRFATAAVAAGAALVIAERELDVAAPVIVVPRGLDALWALAREAVARVRAGGALRIVAVTGSNGKTTTKNLLRAILSSAGPTVAPVGSFNNEVGTPISMLRVTPDTRYLVVELGADAEGEIAAMTSLAVPDVAIVLKVGQAHIGRFGGQEAIARAKSELVQPLPPTAVAILNREDPFVAAMSGATAARVVWFEPSTAVEDPAVWSAGRRAIDLAGTAFVLHHGGVEREVRLPIIGEHHVANALAALAAAAEVGVGLDEALAALAGIAETERWRMEVLESPEGWTVINDAYNASPESMAAALRALAELTRGRARAVAVLGEMAELGSWALEAHDRIGRQVVRLNIDLLVVVGERARAIHLAAVQEGSWGGESIHVESLDDAYDVVRGLLEPGDVVLVKSSKSAELRFLGDRLAGRP